MLAHLSLTETGWVILKIRAGQKILFAHEFRLIMGCKKYVDPEWETFPQSLGIIRSREGFWNRFFIPPDRVILEVF